MIAEDYCSEEVSKLLQEKGFKEPCIGLDKLLCKEGEKPVLRITHQKARAWLREKYHIYADPVQQGNYNDGSMYYSFIVSQIVSLTCVIHRNPSVVDKFSYKQSVEAALKYVLENLI